MEFRYCEHKFDNLYIDGWGQDCGISIAYAMEIPQTCAKPWVSTVEISCFANNTTLL